MYKRNIMTKPSKPFNYIRAKGITKHARNQGNLIHEDTLLLLKKEEENTLSEDDIKKFRLLIAREPVIKKLKEIKD
jgi:hypothetical protein